MHNTYGATHQPPPYLPHGPLVSLCSKIRWKSLSLIAGGLIVTMFYLVMIFADYVSPYEYKELSIHKAFAPPTSIHFIDSEARFHFRPFIYASRLMDPLTEFYVEDKTRMYYLELFSRGYRYEFLGFIPTDIHLFGVKGGGVNHSTPRFHLLGTDEVGRDRFSRLIQASKFSLLVAPFSVLCASLLGIVLGGVAGYPLAGKWLDGLIMRVADAFIALPTLLLILFARALFKPELSEMEAGILMLSLFTLLGWTETSILTRNLVKELKEREFIIAAVSMGLSNAAILRKHILPNIAPFLGAQILLKLPAFLLLETSLSFLGVGVQNPEASWGSLLQAANEITFLHSGHFLLILSPAFAIMLFVFGFRLFSHGLAQATDPLYQRKSVKS